MHELDLIPASYKERLKIKRWCRSFGMIIYCILAMVVGLRFVIIYKTMALNTTIEARQKDKLFNMKQQQIYKALVTEELKLKKDLEILNGFRGGPSAKQILLAIDRIMQDDVWFTQWTFNRAGEITPAPPATVQTGYFIIIPQDDAIGSPNQQAWKLNTHMEISGQALDHSSLSGFVRNLINLPEIDDVKVINTNLRPYINSQVVEFNLAVIINNRFKDEHV